MNRKLTQTVIMEYAACFFWGRAALSLLSRGKD